MSKIETMVAEIKELEDGERAVLMVICKGEVLATKTPQDSCDGYLARPLWQAPAHFKPRDFAYCIALLANDIASKEFLTPEEMAILIAEEMSNWSLA